MEVHVQMLDFLGKAADTIVGMINAGKNRDLQQKMASDNIAMQKEFAQSGIQWRVADAQAAGIHPLAALGAQLSSFNPVTLGDTSAPSTKFGEMGQSLQNAVTRGQDKETKYDTAVKGLQLEKLALDNDLARSRIAQINSAGSAPGIPTSGKTRALPGQGDTPALKLEGQEVVVGPKNDRSRELEPIPDTAYIDTGTGYAPTPGKATKERIEDDFIQQGMWSLRNNLYPTFKKDLRPPSHIKLAPGEFWYFNPLKQEYQIARGMRRGSPIIGRAND